MHPTSLSGPRTAGTTRQKIIRLLGQDLREFLTSRQPDFDDRLGSELLQECPDALLAALQRRQRDFDPIDEPLDHIEVDPLVTGTNCRRTEKELSLFLDLIDNLPISTNGKDGRR